MDRKKRVTHVGSMLGRRLRRLPNNQPASAQSYASRGIWTMDPKQFNVPGDKHYTYLSWRSKRLTL